MLKENIMEVMANVPYFKEETAKAGLKASYIPVVGAIEVMDTNGNQVGISFDGKRIKTNNKYYTLSKYMAAFKASGQILNQFKQLNNG